MDAKRFQSIVEILKSRINAPLAWGVLLMTLALTVLFYFSQRQQVEVYNRYVEALSEYKFFATRIMRKMERVRVFPERDSSPLMSSLRSLRENAVAVYAASEKARSLGWMPPERDFSEFEAAVLGWVASIRRYVPARTSWLDSARLFADDLYRFDVSVAEALAPSLDSARMGFVVTADTEKLLRMPQKLSERYRNILDENAGLASVWNRIDNDDALVRCENLLQKFKMRSLENREVKYGIQRIFYLVSIVLLLFTLFFVIRARK